MKSKSVTVSSIGGRLVQPARINSGNSNFKKRRIFIDKVNAELTGRRRSVLTVRVERHVRAINGYAHSYEEPPTFSVVDRFDFVYQRSVIETDMASRPGTIS